MINHDNTTAVLRGSFLFRHINLLILLMMSMCFAERAAADASGSGRKHLESKRYTIVSINSGQWSDAENWLPARVPGKHDKVLIQHNTTLEYDSQSKAVIHTLHVAGTLNFATDRTTELNVGLLIIKPMHKADHEDQADVHDVDKHDHHHVAQKITAALNVGTAEQPIPAKHTAKIRLHYLEGMNKTSAPAVIARPGGAMNFHGQPLSRTWVKLEDHLKPGENTLQLKTIPKGWKAGDEVILTASKRAEGMGTFRPGSDHTKPAQTEQRIIKQIKNNTITLDKPVQFEHWGEGEFRSEIANLTRNVIVESADPKGIRGHTMYHYGAAGSIAYARFAHLGKENELGRYPIHFHRVEDSMRGSYVIGAAIVDSHNRWVTIHGTHYLIVRDCVGYQSIGHGYFLEDATEVYNLLDHNLAVQAYMGKRMKNQALRFDPNDGAGFWWSNGRNSFTRNVACENDEYGFRYDMQHSRYQSATLPIRQPDGSTKDIDVRTIPIWRFDNNEVHSEGFYGMVVAANGNSQPDSPITNQKQLERFRKLDWTGPDTNHPHTITNLKIWHAHYAFRPHSPAMLMENIRLHGAAYGVYRPAFENHVYRNIHISKMGAEPFNRGMDDASAQTGSITVDGLTFTQTGYGNKSNPLIHLSDNDLSGQAETHIRNLKVIRDERYEDRWPTFNLGGGAQAKPITPTTVPYYVHDYFGAGEHAKIVTTQAKDHLEDGNIYEESAPLTGPDARVARVKDIKFPKLLNPTDDQPPATTILKVVFYQGEIFIRGISHDNGQITRVTVNGLPVTRLDQTTPGVVDWMLQRKAPQAKQFKLVAKAEDAAGNVELTPHEMIITQSKSH